MYVYDDRYHKLIQTLLRLLGLWPYEKTKLDHFRAVCFYVLLTSYLLVQLAQFAIVDFSVDIVIRILSDALPSTVYIVKFNFFFFDTKPIKRMMEQVIKDRQMLKDPREMEIVEHYDRQGKYYTIIITSFVISAVFGFVILELLPDILDFSWSLNDSRTHYLPSMNEYCRYRGTRFYLLLLYVVVSTLTGCFSLVSVGTLLMTITLHSCAMLKISSYRIERIVDKRVIACPDKRSIMNERIIKSVELHRNAQNLVRTFISSYSITLMILLILAVSCLSINLFRLLRSIMQMDNMAELVVALAFVIGHQMYLLAFNYFGQLVTDHNNEVFNAIYKSLWYVAPLTVQRLLLFMMQNVINSHKLTLNGMFTPSLESFISLSSMSMSYFTVIYSIQ